MEYLTDRPVILCLAHLGWDYVWQRPQQILSRIAPHSPVIYINEPHIDTTSEGTPRVETVVDQQGVAAYQPLFPNRSDSYENWRQHYLHLIDEILVDRGYLQYEEGRRVPLRPIVAWFYTPIPFYLLDEMPFELVVYDIMDELANFRGAAPDLKQREARLLAEADLIFVGGRGMYESRRGHHPHLHLFPSGVDISHFATALAPETEIAEEVAALSPPVLGYYGVVDERIDLPLLAEVASRRPEWSFAMVGPVNKIGRHDLPQGDNIHYTGQQPYERLPNFLKGFDVCLMPFAINAATRYISPTKALEYMAANRAIVSTPVLDVIRNWGEVVYVADGPERFEDAVQKALSEGTEQRMRRCERERAILARSGWDTIACQMQRLIEEALRERMKRGR